MRLATVPKQIFHPGRWSSDSAVGWIRRPYSARSARRDSPLRVLEAHQDSPVVAPQASCRRVVPRESAVANEGDRASFGSWSARRSTRLAARCGVPPREGRVRYQRGRDREKACLSAIRTYGYSGGFVLAFRSGEGPLRMGREKGSGEPDEAWDLIREGAVRLR